MPSVPQGGWRASGRWQRSALWQHGWPTHGGRAARALRRIRHAGGVQRDATVAKEQVDHLVKAVVQNAILWWGGTPAKGYEAAAPFGAGGSVRWGARRT